MGSLATIGSIGLRVLLSFFVCMPVCAMAEKTLHGVTVTGCPASLAESLPELLSLELQGVVEIDPTKTPVLAVRCTDKRVIASASLGKHTLDRRFERAKLPNPGGERLLALTLVELHTAMMEKLVAIKKAPPLTRVIIVQAPGPPSQAPEAAVKTITPFSGPGHQPQITLAVSGRGRSFIDGLSLWGPELQVETEPCSQCILRWAFGSEWSLSQDFSTGDISSVLFSTAMGFGYRVQRGEWVLSGVGGLRLGHGSFRADPDPGTVGADHQGFWGGTALNLGAVHAVSSRWAVSFDLEVGYTLWSVRAQVENQNTLSLAGVWVAPALGLQFAFDPR